MKQYWINSSAMLLLVATAAVNVPCPMQAQNAGESRISVFTPDTENVYGAEKAWLPGSVRDKLEANLRIYTTFVLIDRANEDKIKALQMKSEDAAYSEATVIEVGKLTSANCALFSTIRWTGKSYILNAGVTNLTTGERMASAQSAVRQDAASLFSGAGCAVDEVIIALCKQLRIGLSSSQVYVLQHGDAQLSNADRLAMSQEEAEAFKKQIALLDAQIAEYSLKTDLTAQATKAKLETERALAEERAKASADRAKRLQEESMQKAADAQRDAERSIERKRQRDELSALVSSKAEEARNLKMEGQSVLERLLTIESKKRTLIEIRTSIKKREEELYGEAEKEASEKETEISSREYRKAETTADGTPTKKASATRQEEIKKARDAIYTRAKDTIAEMSLAGGAKQQDVLLTREIKDDIKNASRKYTASSLKEEVKVSFKPYDGEKLGWDIDVYVSSDGEPLSVMRASVKYRDLLGADGKKLPLPEKDYNHYLEAVDIYDSLFSRGDPILTFETDYTTSPRSDNHPSEYTFTFSELRMIDTRSGKIISKSTPAPHTAQKKFSPAYDMHSLKVIEDKEKAAKKLQEDLLQVGLSQDEANENAADYLKFKVYENDKKKFIVIEGFAHNIVVQYDKSGRPLESIDEGEVSRESVVIPKTINGIPVLMVADEAFKGNPSIKSVTLKDVGNEEQYLYIGKRAFFECTALRKLSIINSGHRYCNIGSSAFAKCTALETVIIENSRVAWENNVFRGCKGLSKDMKQTIKDARYWSNF